MVTPSRTNLSRSRAQPDLADVLAPQGSAPRSPDRAPAAQSIPLPAYSHRETGLVHGSMLRPEQSDVRSVQSGEDKSASRDQLEKFRKSRRIPETCCLWLHDRQAEDPAVPAQNIRRTCRLRHACAAFP